jgi:thiol-disulfide isomerase/thioredoxin
MPTILSLFAVLPFACPQQPVPAQEAMPTPAAPIGVEVTVELKPADVDDGRGLGWSPKAAAVPLKADGAFLVGAFALGGKELPNVRVRLGRSEGAERHDLLWIDADRDGTFAEAERLETTPKDQRGKWWSSFSTTLSIPVAGDGSRPYPLSLWFVADPQEPDAPPTLRWTRRGWHHGEATLGGKPVFVLVTEMRLDGVFDQRDAWAIAGDRAALLRASSTGLERHVWYGGVAYRPTAIDRDGRSLTFESFAPGVTEAEEKAKADVLAPDRNAPRAAKPLAFGKDLAAALAEAKASGKRVFVDFETTWCGPCKTMTELVYTAAPVVDAAKGVVSVKLDGDEQREWVKKYGVAAYPTMLLLDAEGNVLRREVGYRGVAAMVKFFAE